MNQITRDLGLKPAIEPLEYGNRRMRTALDEVRRAKVPGESKLARRMSRRQLVIAR